MQLYGSNTSPYVRKVRIQALEGEYWDQIDFFEMATAPTTPNMDNVNPLKKVPALATDDGQVLFDSRVVCEYLDQALGGGTYICLSLSLARPDMGNFRVFTLKPINYIKKIIATKQQCYKGKALPYTS